MTKSQIINAAQEYIIDDFMTKKQADAYRLITFQNHTYKEAGKTLGISTANARKHYLLASKKMSRYMKLISKILSLINK